jgi:hypothetical protein
MESSGQGGRQDGNQGGNARATAFGGRFGMPRIARRAAFLLTIFPLGSKTGRYLFIQHLPPLTIA